jgi:hypothetical protein
MHYASFTHKLYSQTPELRVTGLEPFEFTMVQVLRALPFMLLQYIQEYSSQQFSTPATVRRMSLCGFLTVDSMGGAAG